MKMFPVRLAQELHVQVKIAAAQSGQTMMDWILTAIRDKLGKDGV